MAEAETIEIEVAYASQDSQTLMTVRLPVDSSVTQAIQASEILQQHPEIELSKLVFGVYGQICSADKTLANGDRVEIYRPLLHDPMTARRQRMHRPSGK